MSKITYCSLEEAWGDSFNRKDRNEQQNNQGNQNKDKNWNSNGSTLKVSQIQSNQFNQQNKVPGKNWNEPQYSQQNRNNQKIYDRNKYDKLIEDSDDNRADIINNMNKIERNYLSEGNNQNSLVEYNRYRINPKNQVKEYNEPQYTPFQESLDKKYLQDKLNHLENEFTKYKNMINDNGNNVEHFNNNSNNDNNYSSNKDNDIIDLIVLIIIGLLVIFVLNSIFNIGKAIGARNRG
jgi:hypothetical protein